MKTPVNKRLSTEKRANWGFLSMGFQLKLLSCAEFETAKQMEEGKIRPSFISWHIKSFYLYVIRIYKNCVTKNSGNPEYYHSIVEIKAHDC